MNIIVTGGSNGIGKQTALFLADNKENNVLITGRNKNSLSKVAGASVNKNIGYLVTDFNTLHNSPGQFKKDVSSVFDSIDIVINNAGSLHSVSFLETTEEQAREMMEVNFFAPMLLIRTLRPLMNHGSHIVNISSMGGFQGSVKFPGLSYYSASKAALACISECLAGELREYGISVNCLALGSVQTEMFENAFPGSGATVTASEMGKLIGEFALTGANFYNGKIIPVAMTTP